MLPMKKTSTSVPRCKSSGRSSGAANAAFVITPKSSTINFIRRFARVYSYDARLEASLPGFIAN